MSIEAVSLVLNHSRAQGRAKLVLIGIANHLGDQGAWPSIATLARYSNASERSVKRDIQELIEIGELAVEINAAPTSGQYKTNRYWILLDPLGVAKSGVTESTPGVTESTPGVTDWVSRGDNSGQSGVTPVGTQNIIRTIKEPSINTAIEFDSVFDAFWAWYPRKENKQSARRAFKSALKVVDAETIIEGAKRFGSDPNLPPTQYIPHAATWLNQSRWENGPLPERIKTPDEIRNEQAQRSREALDKDRKATEEWLAEQERLAEQARLNPPKRCEHDRVQVICPKCSEYLNK